MAFVSKTVEFWWTSNEAVPSKDGDHVALVAVLGDEAMPKLCQHDQQDQVVSQLQPGQAAFREASAAVSVVNVAEDSEEASVVTTEAVSVIGEALAQEEESVTKVAEASEVGAVTVERLMALVMAPLHLLTLLQAQVVVEVAMEVPQLTAA